MVDSRPLKYAIAPRWDDANEPDLFFHINILDMNSFKECCP